MNIHRQNDGVEYLDRGDYVEKLSGKNYSQSYVYQSSKGRYFYHRIGKRKVRIYIPEN